MAETYDPVARLNELVKSIEFAMLTTVRPNGTLHSAPMATRQLDANGFLWFFTSNKTEKVEAIKTEARVNVAYADTGSQRYVSLSGYAELVRDHPKAKELWSPLYQAWFPKGLDDPDLILIKVHVQDAEYWDAPQGRMMQLMGFAKAAMGDQRYEPGGRGEISLPANQQNR